MSSDLPVTKSNCQRDCRSLPRDLLEIIFCRTDLQAIARCKRLSHEWRSFLFSSDFVIQWCKKNMGFFGFYASFSKPFDLSMFIPKDQALDMPSLSLDFLPAKCKLYATSLQGLVVCASKGFLVRYYICRPISQEWILLPPPRWHYQVKRMAVAVSRDPPYGYKIVRLFDKGPDASSYGCEMLDSDVWRWLSYKINLKRDHVISREPPVLYNGSFHWMIDDGRFIFAFNIVNGKSRNINLPDPLATIKEGGVDRPTIASIEGRLVCLHLHPTTIDIWSLCNFEPPEWEFSRRIVLPHELYNLSGSIVSFLFSDLAFVTTQSKCICLKVLKDCSAQILGDYALPTKLQLDADTYSEPDASAECIVDAESDPQLDYIFPFFTHGGPSTMPWRSNCRSSRNPTWSMRSQCGGERCKKRKHASI